MPPGNQSQKVPILVYHHVYPDGDPGLEVGSPAKATGVISESEFTRQVRYIASQGWEVVSTSRVVEWLHGGDPPPARAVVLHFDNGWLDTRTVAMPILAGLGMTGTCYVISEPTAAASEGKPAGIRTSTEGLVYKPFLTWDHAREMLDAGWEIGAHTATHPKLADVHSLDGDAGVLAEVEGPNAEHLTHLGFVPVHFAYPSGSRSERTDKLLAPFYRSLRLWSFSHPPVWIFADRTTSPLALECQNVDSTVSFSDFTRIFDEAES